jgi:HSP20 family molecular chaperone IbpA
VKLLFLIFFSFNIFAQSVNDINDIMEMQRKMLERMSERNTDFDKRVQEMMKKFQNMGAIRGFQMRADINTFWKKENDHYVYYIEIGNNDNVDLDIKGGMITISGKMKKQANGQDLVYSFNKSESIPKEAIESSAKISKQDNYLVVKFKLDPKYKTGLPSVKLPKGKDI